MMFKPLLAPREVPVSYPQYWDKLVFPLLGSPKYDGIRGYVQDGVVLSRTAKPLPSYQVQDEFSKLEYADGEFIEGNPTDADVFLRTTSHVMSEDKPGDIHYHVFDWTEDVIIPFEDRNRKLHINLYNKFENVHCVAQTRLDTLEELLSYEERMLQQGFEGIMLRTLHGRYKLGRATINDGIIYKLKRFIDAEGVLVDIEEQMTNTNIQERSELGYAKRSSAMAGLAGAKTTGKFILAIQWSMEKKAIDTTKTYSIDIPVSPGNFNHKQRKDIWDNWPRDKGKLIKFRFFAHGIKDLPRHPRAVGFRDKKDI